MMEEINLINSGNRLDNAVYQCLNCRTIVADSTSLQSSLREQHAIVVSSASGTVQADVPRLEPPSYNVYFEVQCTECSRSIGRIYRSTTPNLDYLRDKVILKIDQIIVYQLGTTQKTNTNCNVDDMLVLTDSLDWARVDTELAKLKSFCCVLHEAIHGVTVVKDENL